MSEAFLVRRGGSTKLFAVIVVTYPAGSTCTCTDGVKSFAAKDTSGQWFFPIPYAASWTVTAIDGTDTATETVEITAQGQSAVVTLQYGRMFYEAGTIKDGLTFKRVGGGTGTADMANSGNVLTLTSAYGSGLAAIFSLHTGTTIDLTPYKTFTMHYNSVGAGQTSSPRLFVDTKYSWGDGTPASSYTKLIAPSSSPGVVSYDISSFSGSYYLGLYVINGVNARTTTIEVTKMGVWF